LQSERVCGLEAACGPGMRTRAANARYTPMDRESHRDACPGFAHAHMHMHMHMCDRTCIAGAQDRGACRTERVCSVRGRCCARIESLRFRRALSRPHWIRKSCPVHNAVRYIGTSAIRKAILAGPRASQGRERGHVPWTCECKGEGAARLRGVVLGSACVNNFASCPSCLPFYWQVIVLMPPFLLDRR